MSGISCPFVAENSLNSCVEGCNHFLYRANKCDSKCPANSHKEYVDREENGEITIRIYLCFECYSLCNGCYGIEENNNMNCHSCISDYILYDGNCYQIIDSNLKTFYELGSSTQITNCHQISSDLYIKDNGNECIYKPENYFVVNYETGIISKCDTSCKTCNGPSINNCLTCNSDNYLLDGKCLSNCPDGFTSINYKCLKCHKNCLTCLENANYDNENNLISMGCSECINNTIFIKYETSNIKNCFPIIKYFDNNITFDIHDLKLLSTDEIKSDDLESEEIKESSCLYFNRSIFYGEYECIIKPDKTYYILNNEFNTGIIKQCHSACDSCVNGPELNNTNCITCIEGYFKTEDSNTNCIPINSIPENYYKNNTDNIYYKCYFTCSKCDIRYESNNNMNCD